MLRSFAARVSAFVAGLFAFASAYAIDTASISTALTAAQGDAITVGQAVVAVVAGLVVVGIIIGLVKKL